VGQAIGSEVESLKQDVTSDCMQLLRQVEAESEKHLGAMDDAIGTIRREIGSINELIGAIERIKQSKDDSQLLRSFRVLHSSATDLIIQHQNHQQVCTAILFAVCHLRRM